MQFINAVSRRKKAETRMGYFFILPSVAFLLFFIFISIIYSFYMSFFEWTLFDLGTEKVFVGIDNYLKTISDNVFGTVISNTFILVIVCLSVEIILGFLISLTLWNIKKTLRVINSIILLPMITSPVVVGLIWRYIYDPQFGIINYLLRTTIGIEGIAWLGDPSTSLLSVMIVDIWQMTPFVVLILFTSMMNVSEELVEAARVDGAKYWQVVRKIILPSIAPFISFVMLIRSMDLFKIFDTIYVMTKGGPGYSTETIALYTYKTGFSFYDMGYSMSLSMITLFCIMMMSIVYIKISKRMMGDE